MLPSGVSSSKIMAWNLYILTRLLQVWDIWEIAAGPVIAQNAKPVALKEKLLMVHVADSSWMHELSFLKTEIIRNINGTLGDDLVENIRFTIGPV